MFAAAHVDKSQQIDDKMYALLEYHCDVPLKSIQFAFCKFGPGLTASCVATSNVRCTCHLLSGIAGAAAAKLPLRAAPNVAALDVAEVAADSIVTGGSIATFRTIALGVGIPLAFVSSTAIEIPFLARGIYKLHRKKKFNKIDDVTFKRGCARQTSMSIGTVVGGTAGAVAGSFIPVPVVGTVLGGVAGSLVGVAAGCGVGYGIGSAFKEGLKPDFIILSHLYTDY